MLSISFHGHACFSLSNNDYSIIIDPWFAGNPLANPKSAEKIKCNAILVSHGHFDHLGDAIEISKQNNAPIIGVAELCKYCNYQGAETHSMHIGGSRQFDFAWVKLTPAWHGSSVVTRDGIIYTGNPCGFLVKMDGLLVYHAGDTGLFGDMELIARQHPIDVALLPIGDNFVMGPEDALTAAELLKPKVVIPMHFNTFEIIQQDLVQFAKKIEEKGHAKAVVLEPGEKYVL